MQGQVLKIHSDFYYVKFAESADLFECKIREVIKKQKEKVYVGDFVDCRN